MAVDGVAPRAKMNQQRGRRFRSAREAEEAEKRALRKGEELPKEERFDSNCITPGTEFMSRLHEHLKFFVSTKISTDKSWRGIRIYLSGHETPGEGEHKIMEFIRSEKAKPDYNSNTRHCLYGLDADLIMLGLCTHEPHFSLLREEVKFGGKTNQKRMVSAQETTFHLLHLSLMREYLDFEFASLKGKLSFDYNLEKIIDDWVLMEFLVGNDFIPHLPQMHIAHDALPALYSAYIAVLPTLDGYINEGGYLNLARFETYLKRVAQYDYKHFDEHYADLKWFRNKSGRKGAFVNKRAAESTSEKKRKLINSFALLNNIDDDDFQDDNASDDCVDNENQILNNRVVTEKLIDLDSPSEEDDDELGGQEIFEMEFRQHKRDYYMNKLEYTNVTTEVLKDQAECYVRAIQWNLHYYYNGVCSWSWYYPHHYAPYISDVEKFSHLTLEFELGTPFLPFQQLLAVLPAASRKLLPVPYQSLMCTENSPLIEYYPLDFKTDLNGKLQEWEAVVLIPFIKEVKYFYFLKIL
uniref:Uncharacterized protein n=1 Tax=Strigamia maritima TaxID=126957 RepID=T1JKJ5_STRMM